MGTIRSDARAERTVRAANEVTAIGRRVHDIRAARGLSLQEFAAATGLAAPVLASLERGERTSSLSTLFTVADALGVSALSLFAAQETATDAGLPRVPPMVAAPTASRSTTPHPSASSSASAADAEPERVPRTFADLRTGALEGRAFETLQQFAVAAVHEARFSVAAIARVFRVPAWKLQGWVDEKDTQR